MPVSADVRTRVQALLRPDEALRYVIPVTTEVIAVFQVSFFETFLVVTDQRILVVTGGALRRGRPKNIDRELPRATRLGPLERNPEPAVVLGGVRYEIEDDAVPDVLAADAEIGFPASR